MANKTILAILRQSESLFYSIGGFFEDIADGLDLEFQEELRQALDAKSKRVLTNNKVHHVEISIRAKDGKMIYSSISSLNESIEYKDIYGFKMNDRERLMGYMFHPLVIKT